MTNTDHKLPLVANKCISINNDRKGEVVADVADDLTIGGFQLGKHFSCKFIKGSVSAHNITNVLKTDLKLLMNSIANSNVTFKG